MECTEVRSLLEGPNSLAGLNRDGEGLLADILSHAEHCDGCRAIYRARLVCDSLIQARSAAIIEPPPFFETRIMAAIRERGAQARRAFLPALWREAGVVLTSIVAVVVILVSLTLMAGPRAAAIHAAQGAQDTTAGPYSAEQVVMGDAGGDAGSAADDSLSNAQVVDTVFNSDE